MLIYKCIHFLPKFNTGRMKTGFNHYEVSLLEIILMDFIPIVILLILAGLSCGFALSVLSGLTQDTIQELMDRKPASGIKLKKLKMEYSDDPSAFHILEMFLYSVSVFLTGYFFHDDGILIPALACFIAFLLIVFLRILFISIGRRYADNLARQTAPMLYFLGSVSNPFFIISSSAKEKIAGAESQDDTLEELNTIVETAMEEGTLDAGEYRILKSIMKFREVLVSDVMTPRTVVFSCEADKTVGEVLNMPELQMYSRFPIWEGNSLDEGVVGYVMTKDVLRSAINNQNSQKIRELARDVYFIPEKSELDNALDLFLQRREHLFLVVDEYGGVEGILTMEDVLEAILGAEIVDEADRVVDLRELAKQRRDRRIAQK
jgi:CBS domain containing-hemolysin-like protein